MMIFLCAIERSFGETDRSKPVMLSGHRTGSKAQLPVHVPDSFLKTRDEKHPIGTTKIRLRILLTWGPDMQKNSDKIRGTKIPPLAVL